jgi:hypothetical protein
MVKSIANAFIRYSTQTEAETKRKHDDLVHLKRSPSQAFPHCYLTIRSKFLTLAISTMSCLHSHYHHVDNTIQVVKQWQSVLA